MNNAATRKLLANMIDFIGMLDFV